MNLIEKQKKMLEKVKKKGKVNAENFPGGYFEAFPKLLDLRAEGLLNYEGEAVFSINEKGKKVLEDGTD